MKQNRDETLKDVGVAFYPDVRNQFVLSDPKGTTYARRRPRALLKEGEEGEEKGDGGGEHTRPPVIGSFSCTKSQWYKGAKGDLFTEYPHYLPGAGPTIPAPPSLVPSNVDSSPYSVSTTKSDTRYVGLVNQAMTCYLNSLLQALYMTPEFRNALYEWCYDGTEEGTTNSIPFHLQKLFLNLQTSSRPAVETTELTKSFGWESSTAWQQHDVQELCRVMFDALEQKFKNTPHADLIQRLYEGTMIDSVKCRECSTEKCRKDTFLDIPLAVRPFGLDVAYGSVEEALRAFVQPETLDGNNQYHCESCNKKCDAYKMLKFAKFPYILTLHLKRFDFDCNTLHRIKLNDKVVFPKILDLNSFVEDATFCKGDEEGIVGGGDDKRGSDIRCDDGASSTTDSGSALDEDHNGGCYPLSAGAASPVGDQTQSMSLPQQPPPPAPPPSSSSSLGGTGDTAMESQEDDEGIDVSSVPRRKTKLHNHINHDDKNCHQMDEEEEDEEEEEEEEGGGGDNNYDCFSKGSQTKSRRKLLENQTSPQTQNSTPSGPFVYELFSIMIHSGSATGGHYYAYIKDFATGEWLCFNDQSVSHITEEDIKKTYGGGLSRGYYSGAYSSSTNAYMLMYRQIDKNRNCLAMTVDQFPPHIKELLAAMREREEQERAARERDLDSIKMKVFVNHPLQNTLVDARLLMPKTQTLKEAVTTAYQTLELEGLVDLERCRLVSYDQVLGSIECSFEGREDEPVGVVSRVYFVDVDSEDVKSPVILRKNMNMTVGDFKECLYRDLKLCPDVLLTQEGDTKEENRVEMEKRPPLFIVMERHNMEIRLLDDDSMTLKKESFGKHPKIFVSTKMDDELHKPFVTSKLYRIVRDFVHIITLKVTLPDVSKDVLERMSIPPLSAAQCQPKVVPNGEEGTFEDNVNYDLRKVFHRLTATSPNVEEEDEGIGDGECVGGAECPSGDVGGASMCVPVESEVSGRNSDQSASEDSSLTDSSDHENAISSPEEGNGVLSLPAYRPNECASRKDLEGEDAYNEEENWDNDLDVNAGSKGEPSHFCTKFYFKVSPWNEASSSQKILKVQVDKRMLLNNLKLELEPFVGVSVDYFKLFRVTGHQEYECNRPSGLIALFQDGDEVLVKLGRVLRRGECLGKVYQLAINETEHSKFLCEFILCKGQTVLSAKQQILAEIKKKLSIDIPIERCRLRKKCWKNPGKVFIDNQRFHNDINLLGNWEMFIQEMPPPKEKTAVGGESEKEKEAVVEEKPKHDNEKTDPDQLCLFVRRWHPDKLELGNLEEVVLNDSSVQKLKEKLSEMSGIPVERIEIAPADGQFPYIMPILSVHSEMEWDTQKVQSLTEKPFKISDDGVCVFYRDSADELRKPSPEEKPVLASRRMGISMLGSSYAPQTYSPRRERALKIYLATTPSPPPPASTVPQKDDCEVD
ncbi:hypothetical protein J437_LFUL015393 [Ladona fulva]|uniref:Ubiquitin carboxyl-terminal hydrolase 47 n=1 Tax=Ladona fulva TaxID=123851 RepID=A0A8K0KJQ9_LADFU|nr:hypothetical protein J437_LFUL015393 [Ladona fulva]